jgi:hypothetical protein
MEDLSGYFIASIVCKNAMLLKYSSFLENLDKRICTNNSTLNIAWISTERFYRKGYSNITAEINQWYKNFSYFHFYT